MTIRSLKLKNRSYYFWDDQIYINDFYAKSLKLDKKESLLDINIYYIGYVTKKDKYDINNVNPLYLIIPFVEGYVERTDNSDNRTLIITLFDNNDDFEHINATPIDSVAKRNVVISSVDKNEEVLKKLDQLWKHIEDKIGGSIENRNQIRFNSDAVLPLKTPIKFHALTVVFRCAIMKDSKFYPEVYLDDGLYEI